MYFVAVRLKRDSELGLQVRRNLRCPVGRGRYSSEIFVCNVVNGIVFYKALNLTSCNVMCSKLYCGVNR